MAEVFAVAIIEKESDTLLAYGEDRTEAKARLEQYYGDYRESYRIQEFAEGDEMEFVELLKDNFKIRKENDAEMYVDYADWQSLSLADIESWERNADSAFRGKFADKAEFAEQEAEAIAESRMDSNDWPYRHINWEKAADELFEFDFYISDNGFVWRVQ
jgi:hypothetical protein